VVKRANERRPLPLRANNLHKYKIFRYIDSQDNYRKNKKRHNGMKRPNKLFLFRATDKIKTVYLFVSKSDIWYKCRKARSVTMYLLERLGIAEPPKKFYLFDDRDSKTNEGDIYLYDKKVNTWYKCFLAEEIPAPYMVKVGRWKDKYRDKKIWTTQ
jgi:hypothetical protein